MRIERELYTAAIASRASVGHRPPFCPQRRRGPPRVKRRRRAAFGEGRTCPSQRPGGRRPGHTRRFPLACNPIIPHPSSNRSAASLISQKARRFAFVGDAPAAVAVVADAPQSALRRGSGDIRRARRLAVQRRRAAVAAHTLCSAEWDNVSSTAWSKEAGRRKRASATRARAGAPFRARRALTADARGAGDTLRRSAQAADPRRHVETTPIGLEPAGALRLASAPAVGEGRRRGGATASLLRGAAAYASPGQLLRALADGTSRRSDPAPCRRRLERHHNGNIYCYGRRSTRHHLFSIPDAAIIIPTVSLRLFSELAKGL